VKDPYEDKQHFSQKPCRRKRLVYKTIAQCDQTFSAVITKRCAEILPNWIFFYQTRANSAF
jgi:hypothetical protein